MPAHVCALREQQREGRRCPLSPAFGRPHGGTPPPRLVSKIRAGQRSPRGPRAAFHPLAQTRLEALFIPETPAWKNERRQPHPSSPYPFSRSGQRRSNWGRLASCRPSHLPLGMADRARAAERQDSASCCLWLAREIIHSFKLALSSLVLFTFVQPLPRQAWRF